MNDYLTDKLIMNLIKFAKKAKTESEKLEIEDLVSKYRRCSTITFHEGTIILMEVE